MKASELTFSKVEAQSYLKRNRRSDQIYMYRFDVDVVFRKGKLDDEQIGKVRYKEDSRPQKIRNKHTGRETDKKNDIVTFKIQGKNDCWWIITKGAEIADGLVIAKDMFKDSEGNTHYSVEPDRDMLLSEYIEKLNELKKHMRQKDF
ncbi:hypothetical protein BTA51_22365 [Hahella sp. CCB-MM4]|uniref:Tse2 family ADP-ribosyltransferase toxin n=1 Tax=Hahella sp. (strain CCB-MM4) TaxID=1926491 RepID=UPI000B9BA736|nr:hypothetical protein [Hahella sp. CCB-MM4]OZG71125.1 hypothetical protein BTA51_22365 [Hahella sp. CCB-MM4]